jgi:ATP-dependent Clp protease ATP-binding subunit ClpA
MNAGASTKKVLDLKLRNPAIDPLLTMFGKRIVGQPEATDVLANIVETYLSGLTDPTKPAGNALFLGPTGTGKTRTVEAMCEGLVGNPQACIKIDCAEFQLDHEIAKLVGSPPGYLGHRETPPLLTQKNLDQYWKPGLELSVVLFDEIEKASDTLWKIMLGILDKAILTLGSNEKVNFSKVIIVMTSNLGGVDMQKVLSGGYGFSVKTREEEVSDDKNKDIATNAARKHFTPEFMNRIDNVVVFHVLTRDHVRQIMNIEIGLIQTMIFTRKQVLFQVTPAAKETLMKEGYSVEFGARNMKRAVEQRVRIPLARLICSTQVEPGDCVVIDEVGAKEFQYSVEKLLGNPVKFTDVKGVLE